MTVASALMQSAYREGNLIAVGTTASTAEDTEALSRLNRFLRGLYGHEMGEGLLDWDVPAPQRTAPVAANYPQLPATMGLDANVQAFPLAADPGSQIFPYPPKNSRIIYAAPESSTVYFPEAPDDGSRMGLVQGGTAPGGVTLTLDGNGRLIEGDPTVVLTTPITARSWLYRADLGNWLKLTDLALTDESPFPEDMDDLLITGLAIRLAPTYDKTIGAETASTFKSMLAKFKARYRQAGTTIFGSQDFPRSLQSYAAGRWWF